MTTPQVNPLDRNTRQLTLLNHLVDLSESDFNRIIGYALYCQDPLPSQGSFLDVGFPLSSDTEPDKLRIS
jgi:hypothetical protein